MNYIGRIFRPPSEARSLIIQITVGCSHNKCNFCTMYKEKQFRVRKIEEVKPIIDEFSTYHPATRRIFLADGDALIAKTEYLKQIINYIHQKFKHIERIGIYGSSRAVNLKTEQELKELKQMGLGIIYMGLESGSDQILKYINKGETVEQIITAGQKVIKAGIKLSLTAISGMGGLENSQQHAIQTAKAVSQIKPDYLGLLTLMVEKQTSLYQDIIDKKFTLMDPYQIAHENILLLENIDSQGTILRANHASNYLDLNGTLNQDKQKLIQELKQALQEDDAFKPEYFRLL